MARRRSTPAGGRAGPLVGCTVCLLLAGADQRIWLTGTPLAKALEQPVTVVQQQAELRQVLKQLAEVQGTACVLDRRIDPSTPVTLQLQQAPLREAFVEAARQAHAECLPLGGTLVIGPASELDRILSQAEALQGAIKGDKSLPAARRLQLARDHTLTWQELDRPLDVLEEITRLWGVEIANPELLPHDLWAAGTAAGLDAAQALSLILGQFEFSFRVVGGGAAVEIVPLPDRIAVERAHRPQGMSLSEAIEAIRVGWPQATATPRGTGLAVVASVLEHAAISRRLGEVRESKPAVAGPTPLARRRFPNVKIVRKPAADVLAALQAQGIAVVYDADALRQAGVDLSTLVSLEFDDATADEFFAALCAPLQVEYRIDGATVTLRPR